MQYPKKVEITRDDWKTTSFLPLEDGLAIIQTEFNYGRDEVLNKLIRFSEPGADKVVPIGTCSIGKFGFRVLALVKKNAKKEIG